MRETQASKTQAEMTAHDKVTWKLYNDAAMASARVAGYVSSIRKAESGRDRYMSADRLAEIKKYYGQASVKLDEARAVLDKHEEAYTGWSRFWAVPNGHIHSSTHCSTCNNGSSMTQFYLASEVSGLDEAAAVAAQGPLLCTVCFPSAPVEWTNGLDAKKASQCSGKRDYEAPSRTGYYAGNWATCDTCKQRITTTSTGKLRAHKPKAS